MPKELNKTFTRQPSYPGGGGSRPLEPPRPLGPSCYFRLPIMNPCRPPLPQNKPYRQPFNYPEYEKNFNPCAHVRVFKIAIKANGEKKM
jgi:hypothetical protein